MVALLLPAPLAAQAGWDLQGHLAVLVRDSTFVGPGIGGGLRLGRGLRLAATVTPGWRAPDGWGGRGEAKLAYHLYPPRPTGVGWYLAGGLAGEIDADGTRGFALVLLGVEVRPWRGGGLFAELGVGGGGRVAAGYRAVRLRRR